MSGTQTEPPEGPVRAEIDDPFSGVVTLASYHYDLLMRLRRVKLNPENGEPFSLVPVTLEDGSLGLERREGDG